MMQSRDAQYVLINGHMSEILVISCQILWNDKTNLPCWVQPAYVLSSSLFLLLCQNCNECYHCHCTQLHWSVQLSYWYLHLYRELVSVLMKQ